VSAQATSSGKGTAAKITPGRGNAKSTGSARKSARGTKATLAAPGDTDSVPAPSAPDVDADRARPASTGNKEDRPTGAAGSASAQAPTGAEPTASGRGTGSAGTGSSPAADGISPAQGEDPPPASSAPASSSTPLWVDDGEKGPDTERDGLKNRLRRFGRRSGTNTTFDPDSEPPA
jgi:hypothetical protein